MKVRLWITLGLGTMLWLGAEAAQAEGISGESQAADEEVGETAIAAAPNRANPPSTAMILSFTLPILPVTEDQNLEPGALPTAEAPPPLPVPPIWPPVSATDQPVPPPPGMDTATMQKQIAAATGAAPPPTPAAAGDLFSGGSESLVARTIGHAEGTRTPEGARTAAYYGHTDPGNGAWNLGSFSYQHGAETPVAADTQQLLRLQRQDQQLQQQAAQKGLSLTLEERLNGLDLANQATTTALTHYIERLHQAHSLGLTGNEAILWARTRSFLEPDSGQWNAPGLGNTIQGVSRDQQRRLTAIAKVLAQGTPILPPAASANAELAAIADYVISLDLPASPHLATAPD